MKTILLLATLCAGILPVLSESVLAAPSTAGKPLQQAGKSPVKVFILAGQSNMEGQSVVDLTGKDYNEGRGTLATLINDPVKGAMFKHLKSADGKWAVRDDVWVRYQRERSPLLAGPLGVGFSVYGDVHHFGAELQFGHVMGDLTGPWLKEAKDFPAAALAIRTAQKAAAAKPEYKGTVLLVETGDFVRKPEDSPHPGHGHHEFGNAETYFLVGDALGKGMLKLLPK